MFHNQEPTDSEIQGFVNDSGIAEEGLEILRIKGQIPQYSMRETYRLEAWWRGAKNYRDGNINHNFPEVNHLMMNRIEDCLETISKRQDPVGTESFWGWLNRNQW